MFQNPNFLNISEDLSHLSLKSRLMYKWFKGKCISDVEWC